MSKIRVAVLYGGISGEHEVSCLSAVSILKNLDPQRYEVTTWQSARTRGDSRQMRLTFLQESY